MNITDKKKRLDLLQQTDLYGITDNKLFPGREHVPAAEALLAAGVKIIQYRDKEKSVRDKYNDCIRIAELCAQAGALFLVNDSVELALAVRADGVHLGQEDLPAEVARRLLGPQFILGVSTHTLAEACNVQAQGAADYIGIGPLYPTGTKLNTAPQITEEELQAVLAVIHLPVVGIGGINQGNIQKTKQAGVDLFAIIADLVGREDVTAAAADLRRCL